MDRRLLPIILKGVGALALAGGGTLSIAGGFAIKRANDRIQVAHALYHSERQLLEAHAEVTNEALRELGTRQAQAHHLVVERMIDFLRRHKKQVSESEKLFSDGLGSVPGVVTLDRSLDQDPIVWVRGILGSVVAGFGAGAGVRELIVAFASASTGTPIAGLSGAAKTNALFAALGGGSKASGGGGIASGKVALNLVAIGPAVLLGGLVVAGQGQKAKTQARATEAAANTAVADMQLTKAGYDAIVARARELGELLDRIVALAIPALDLLESEPFAPELHGDRFERALMWTYAVRDVAAAQVVDSSGKLNEESATFAVTYRVFTKEATDV